MIGAVERASALQAYGDETAGCVRCALAAGRTQVVFGVGNPDADLMFVGEAPGFHEDQQGIPFVGQAGKLLDKLLAEIGLQRSDIYIANTLKCRPPQNRDPLPEEIAACSKYLDGQITAIAPKVIVTLGRHSMQRYFPGEAISRIHGQPRRKDGLIVVPMYHPAAALHQGTLRKVIEADFSRLPEFLQRTLGGEAIAATAAVPAHLRAGAAVGATVAAPSSAEATEAEPQQMRLL